MSSSAVALGSTLRLPTAAAGRRVVAEHAPAFVVALLLLPWIIAHGRAWPWHPSMIDFDVYRLAVQDFLQGKNIYDTSTPGWRLKFIYPPVSALLMTPLAIGPATIWRLVWTALLVWAQQSVLRRCGLPRGWVLGFLGAVCVVALEPIRTTIGYGQVNTLLMALVVADLLPDAPGEKRFFPRGSLIGLAAAIKLTPLLFLVFAFLVGRRSVAWVGAASFALFTGLGAIVMPRETVEFFTGLAKGDTGTAGPIYLGNQSFLGMFSRIIHTDTGPLMRPGLLLGGAFALVVVLAAMRWWRTAPVAAVALVGMATCLASPLSWTHHHVWILPLLACLLVKERIPAMVQALMGVWVLWVAGGFVLYVIGYGGGAEYRYGIPHNVVGGLTPALTIVIALALLAHRPPKAHVDG